MGSGVYKEHLLVVLEWPKPDSILSRLQQKYPYIQITYVRTEPGGNKPVKEDAHVDLDALYKSATILATFRGLPDRTDQVPNVKFIHFFSAGIDGVATHPIYTDTTIPLTTSSGIHGPPITEWIISHTLALSRHNFTIHEWQQHHQWGGLSSSSSSNEGANEEVKRSAHDNPGMRLILASVTDWVGKRVGIAGYGSIGRQAARVFVAMGAQVVVYTASPRPTPESRRDKGSYIIPGTGDPDGKFPSEWYSGTTKEELHAFLGADLDALIISLPLTPQTTQLFGKEEFEVLRAGGANKSAQGSVSPGTPQETRSPLLVNISRGKVVKQPDLVDALNSGVLGGAALDVTDPEPLPKDDPLWDAKNVVITPHISGAGREYFPRSYDILSANIDNLERGADLINLVKRKRGY